MLRKTTSICLIYLLGLTACVSVTDRIPTVKIERKKPKIIKNVATNFQSPTVQPAEAAIVCENDNMRRRSSDGNLNNDMARVLILEESSRSSNVIADIEVNCRDYFRNNTRRVLTSQPLTTSATPTVYTSSRVIQTQTLPIQQNIPAPQAKIIKASSNVQAADGYYYSIKKGDTLYRIAEENCASVKDLSSLNGISDPAKIEIHQIIRLPAKKCNARN